MHLWRPPIDQPHLLEWWRPLLLASRAARRERCPWPIHVDDLVLTGRVDRPSRPSVWVFRHGQSRGELYLDDTGQAYTFTKTPNARSLGRFTPCNIQTAIWRAGLPSFVEPVWYDEARAGHGDRRVDAAPDDDDEGDGFDAGATARRSRGHLRVIDGGRPLAG